jgi:hypothetical protein
MIALSKLMLNLLLSTQLASMILISHGVIALLIYLLSRVEFWHLLLFQPMLINSQVLLQPPIFNRTHSALTLAALAIKPMEKRERTLKESDTSALRVTFRSLKMFHSTS